MCDGAAVLETKVSEHFCSRMMMRDIIPVASSIEYELYWNLRHRNRHPTFYEPFVTKPVVTQSKVPDDRYEQNISTDTPVG